MTMVKEVGVEMTLDEGGALVGEIMAWVLLGDGAGVGQADAEG